MENKLSLCKNCGCMTKTINNRCGKCQKYKKFDKENGKKT